jgi:membrane protein implicated in regulation of membrane protease activity
MQGGISMKKKAKKKILPIVVATLAVIAVAAAPALAKSSKKQASQSSAAAAAASIGSTPQSQEAPKAGQHDVKPGPAWKTVGGTVKQINGDVYMVEDYEGNQVKLYVGQGTKQINKKKVGDTVRAEITRGGFANSIQ